MPSDLLYRVLRFDVVPEPTTSIISGADGQMTYSFIALLLVVAVVVIAAAVLLILLTKRNQHKKRSAAND